MLKKNDILELKIENNTPDGDGIAKKDGYTLFVKNAVAGDVSKIKVLKVNKSYGYAKTECVLSPSDFRKEPKCDVYARCGGCAMMHISYEKQLDIKASFVKNNLHKIGGYKADTYEFDGIIGADEEFGYRNKAQFPVGKKDGKAICGFYAGKSHDIIPCDECRLQKDDINKAVSAVLEFINENHISVYDESTHTGLIRHIVVRYAGDDSRDIMVILVVNSPMIIPEKDRLINKLTSLPNVKSVLQNINTKKSNVVMGDKNTVLFGDDKIITHCGSLKFIISPGSFFQVNTEQMEKLYQKAIEYADIKKDDVVFDLYSGVGSISLFMAKKAKRVIGVEIVKDAVDNAINNAKINGIENASFYHGDCPKIVDELVKEGINADIVVVDPPRKGCDAALLDLIVKISPKKLVYVSCNSATLARDVAYLKGHGYFLKKCTAVDMFPQTKHVECVVLMCQDKNWRRKT